MAGNHPELHNAYVNVKAHFGAKGDGITDDSSAIQAAINAAGATTVFFPKGTYKLGTPLVMASFQTLRGAGPFRGGTTLTCKDIYALTIPASGAASNIEIRDMHITLDGTSTSGGCIQFKNNNYTSNPTVSNVECWGSATSADPVVHLGTWISGSAERMRITNGQIGLQLGGAGLGFSYCNNNQIQTSTFGSNSVAGTLVDSGSEGNTFLTCDWESNTGYGVKVSGGSNTRIYSCWFEGNGKTDIFLRDVWAAKIKDCHFVALSGTVAGNYFVDIQSTSTLDSWGASRFVTIQDNLCMNYPNGGAGLYTHFNIGTNVGGTLIFNNMVWDPNQVDVIADAGVFSEYRRNFHRLFNGMSQDEQMSSWSTIQVKNAATGGTLQMKDGYGSQFRTVTPPGISGGGGVSLGHLYGNTVDYPVSVTAAGAAGSGASATVVGNDLGGIITLNTGTGPFAGNICFLTFSEPYDAVVTNVAVNATWMTNPGSVQLYTGSNKDNAWFYVTSGLTQSTTYKIAYQVVGMTGV